MAENQWPKFYVIRAETGTMVPLVAVDELPRGVAIDNIPEVLTADRARHMTCVGTFDERDNFHILTKQSHEEITIVPRNDIHLPGISPIANPQQSPFVLGQKTHCTHWINTGECAYMQQGCKYIHEVPLTLEGLRAVGLTDYPQWFRKEYGVGSLQATTGSAAALARHRRGEAEPSAPPLWMRRSSSNSSYNHRTSDSFSSERPRMRTSPPDQSSQQTRFQSNRPQYHIDRNRGQSYTPKPQYAPRWNHRYSYNNNNNSNNRRFRVTKNHRTQGNSDKSSDSTLLVDLDDTAAVMSRINAENPPLRPERSPARIVNRSTRPTSNDTARSAANTPLPPSRNGSCASR